MTNTDSKKAALRTELRARRAAIPNDIRRGRDQTLWGRIFFRFPELLTARTLLFYFPLPQEINLIPVFNYARKHGIVCAFPRCREEKGQMDFYLVDSLDELEVGKYGIREPKADARPFTDFSDALMFVPALAYDREGYRIGYGGGYYDRFLAAHDLTSVGVTYEEFLVDSLPRDEYDRAMDIVLTEKGLYRIGKL